MTWHKSLTTAVVIVLALAALGGCGKRQPRGPLFVVFIVDRTASVSELQDEILAYARLALDDYSKTGPIKVTVVNLNESPSVEFQKEGELYEEDVEEVLGHVKGINYDAKGTDIISAFELAQQYHGYEKIPPRAYKILCFTDGLIEGPKGHGYRQWADFDWAKMGQLGASIGIYFVDPKVRHEIETAPAPVGTFFIKNKNDALDDLKNEEARLP